MQLLGLTGGRARRCTAAGLLAALVATLLGTLIGASPASASAPDRSFGPLFSWTSGRAGADYATVLGGVPGVYGETLGYPLDAAGASAAGVVSRAGAGLGASVLLQLIPRTSLAALTGADADRFAAVLATQVATSHVRFVVDFAPEMNGSWTRWGQQPRAFVQAFRTVAAAVHLRVPSAAMLWEPANGAGYPFRRSRGAVAPSGTRVPALLDTNGDGRVDERDDPYGGYWPGRAAVDEVGLSDFWFGADRHLGRNSRPPAGYLVRSLDGEVGYSSAHGAGRDFVTRFSARRHLPLMLETAALWVPGGQAGPSRTSIVDAWLRQVFAPSLRVRFPTLETVLWFEQRGPEPEAGGAIVDWRAGATASTALALRTAVRRAGYPLGPAPVSTVRNQTNAALARAEDATSSGDSGGDRILASVGILFALLLLAGLAGRVRPAWRYPGDRAPAAARTRIVIGEASPQVERVGRDDRIDLLRGFVIAAVVVTHVQVGGPWTWFVQRAGALTGAEMFVLLSGIVLGATYLRAQARFGSIAAAGAMLRRAGRLYLLTAGVVLLVFFAAKVPGIDASPITTFTDAGTGRVYYLYGTASHLLDYPPPSYAVHDLALLRYGPWPINIMGLFVVLSLAVPAAMELVRRGFWWVLLLISWTLYVLDAVHPVRVFDAQFEAAFPLLAWQLLFMHGLVIGRYRTRIVAALTTRAAKTALVVVLAGYTGLLLLLRSGLRWGPLPTYAGLYDSWYQRTELGGGRLVDLALSLVVMHALLTTCWHPLHTSIGRFFEPLGRASLLVFFLQVLLVMAVGDIPHLSTSSAWQGLVVHTACLALLWFVVQRLERRRTRPTNPAPPVGAGEPVTAAAPAGTNAPPAVDPRYFVGS